MNTFFEICKYLPSYLSKPLLNLDSNILNKLCEIRIRRDKAIILIIANSSYFIENSGKISSTLNEFSIVTECNCFDDIFIRMCDHSVYSKTESLKNGYITLNCGARVGICSTAVYDNNAITTVNFVTSLNVRIPRQCKGCSIRLLNDMDNCKSIIVAGPPNCGKTTFLRDMAYQLSNGYGGAYRKLVLVDSRNELAGKQNNEYSLDVGANCDVLTNFEKDRGIEIAIRTLSPEIIVCDEIANEIELEKIMFGFSCGVKFFLSLHISDANDFYNKNLTKMMLNTGEFSHLVYFDGKSFEPKLISL